MDLDVSKLKFNRERDLILGEAKSFAEGSGWEIIQLEYPVLSIVLTRPTGERRCGFRFLCDQWDELPPSLTLFDPASPTVEMSWDKWPKVGWHVGNGHKFYSKPFLCLPGIREYHIHESHLNDHWENLRGKTSYALRYIVDRVHQKYKMTND